MSDGSVYHGSFQSKKPNGMGFICVFKGKFSKFNQESMKEGKISKFIEQVYCGNFKDGKADKFGYLIFDSGSGRYTGEWLTGKYHGEGKFERQIP